MKTQSSGFTTKAIHLPSYKIARRESGEPTAAGAGERKTPQIFVAPIYATKR